MKNRALDSCFAATSENTGALIKVEASDGYRQAQGYDNLGRPSVTATSFMANGRMEHYFARTTYDSIGRVHQEFDAGGDGSWRDQGIEHRYNEYGYLREVVDAVEFNGAPRSRYYQVLEMDLRGNVTRSRQGNGITTERSYYSATGRLRTQRADLFNGLFGELQDKEYEWDELGNLIYRYDYHGEEPVQEDFGYDELNRLKWSKVSGREQVNVDYDALGNISKKSDVGSYSYSYGAECDKSAGPHALCKTSDGTSYWYDANGSMVGDSSGRTIEYSSFDKPTKISKGGHTTRFAYSPSRSRYLRTDESAQDATTLTRYLGNVERITHPGGRLEIKRRLPGGALISYTRSADGQPAGKTTHYLHMDHLGSIDIISNEIGQLVARMSFDPWGQRRDPLNWGPLVDDALSELETNITGITKRGFTGHEMLDEVGLIHMNGRIYDPRLGRFMQADPLIDGVTDTKGYNRYSYVHNNPLNATDPSGFSAWTRFRDNFLKPVIQAIVTAYCIPCGTALAAATTAYYGGDAFDVAVSAFSTYVMTSMGKGFAASGGGFSGGEAFVFGVTGGITSTLRGGKFGHGFVSAYTGAVTGGFVQGLDNAAAELIASSVIAGSISEATGGKFANGAAYGAFSWAVRAGLSDSKGGSSGASEDASQNQASGVESNQGRSGERNSLSAALSIVGEAAGKIWALPNTLVGLAYGGVGMIFGAQPVWDGSAGILRFTNMPSWMMRSALSLGHVQVFGKGFYQNPDGSLALNRFNVPVVTEETLHTRQAEILGPIYLPVHGLSMGASILTGGGTHNNNLLEMGPEKNRGPWPWN